MADDRQPAFAWDGHCVYGDQASVDAVRDLLTALDKARHDCANWALACADAIEQRDLWHDRWKAEHADHERSIADAEKRINQL